MQEQYGNASGWSDSGSAAVVIDTTTPVITSSATISVNENQSSAITIVATEANDITYSISGGDSASFSINSSSGVVTFNSAPDYETKSSYSFTATATDVAGNADTQAVTITILDVVESATLAISTIDDVSVNEGSVYTSVTPSFTNQSDDPIGDLTYTLSGDDAGDFTINASTGVVSMVARDYDNPVDSDTNNTYSLSIVATDEDNNSDTESWVVTVADVDTEAPTVTISPANGATDVSNDANITLTFNETIRYLDDSTIRDNNIENNNIITLKDTNASGADIAFDATISGNVITINPDNDFSSEQVVYAAISASVEDESDNAISETSTTFTAADSDAPSASLAYTVSGSSVSSVNNGDVVRITATFNEAIVDSPVMQISGSGVSTLNATNMTKSSTTSYYYDWTVDNGDGTQTFSLATGTDAVGNVITGTPTSGASITVDNTGPTLSSSVPADNATGVLANANVILTFSEAVTVSTGNIYLKKTSDNSTVETIDITSGQVSGSGSTTITINPSTTLNSSTEYYILIDSGALVDSVGNSYTGISSATALSFTTVDTQAPTVTFDPLNSATGVSASANIVITFSEAVRKINDESLNSGNIDSLIILKETNSSGTDIAFNATFSGDDTTITINPSSSFSSEQVVYVAIEATVEDSSNNAISASSATFTAEDTVSPSISSPSTASVEENQTTAIDINATDTNTITYSISGGDSASFSIDSSSGVVTFDSAPDYETKSSYSFTATATDTAGNASTQSVTITVTDLDEDVPSDTTSPTMTITASGASSVADGSASEDATLTMTFTSNEATSNFVVGDITVGNGTLSSFSATSSTVYTATLTPTAQGAVTVDVAAGAFTDAASNSNTAATQFNWNYLSSPLNKTNVSASVKAMSGVAIDAVTMNFNAVENRLSWLSANARSSNLSHQGIRLNFANPTVDKLMNTAYVKPGKLELNNEFVKLIRNNIKNGEAPEVSAITDDTKQGLSSVAYNEFAKVREDTIDKVLNATSNTKVMGDWNIWTEGRITVGKTYSTSSSSAQDSETQNLSLGFDRIVKDDKHPEIGGHLIGVVLGIGKSDADTTNNSTVDADSYSLSAYGVIRQNDKDLAQAMMGYGHINVDKTRIDGSDTLTGAHDANQFFTSLMFKQKTINVGSFSLSPYGKIHASRTWYDGYSETGGATALTYGEQTIDSTVLSAGVDADYLIPIKNGNIRPFMKFEYGADVSGSSTVNMHYNNETTNYQLQLDNKADSNWKFVLGTDMYTKDEWDSSISYERTEAVNAGYSDSLAIKVGLKF